MKNRIIYIGIVLLMMSIIIAGCIGKEQPVKIGQSIEPTIEPTTARPVDTITPVIIQTNITPIVSKDINKINNVHEYSTYLGIDNYYNALKMRINITTTETGKLVYVENYYSKDGYGILKFYSNERYFDGYINSTNMSIFILRPKDRYGESYSIIEMVFILNGNRTSYWYDLHKFWNK